jgi:sugar phosphate isomerase/epimerase
VKVAFLPLGVRGDLVQHPELRPATVERLRAVGPIAEKAGVVIGVETALDAAGDVKLLEDVGSPAVRSYFNFSNALQNGRDLDAELRTLGKDRICQIHCTDQDGVWLENNPRINMPKVKETLDGMGWSGWLVIERSRDARDSRNVRGNFGANAAYLKKVFQAG